MEETRTRGTFQCFVAATAMLAATAALSRPFFDPRAEKREAIDLDAAFAAEPRDPACHAAQLVSTGGLAARDPHTLAGPRGRRPQFRLAPCGQKPLVRLLFYYASHPSPARRYRP